MCTMLAYPPIHMLRILSDIDSNLLLDTEMNISVQLKRPHNRVA